MGKIKIGLYGNNGHQIHGQLKAHPKAELVAVAKFPASNIPAGLHPRIYSTLDELLSDPEVNFVSLCSPIRREQAEDAIRCMRAGKHVYAEKPCAMTEKDLDRIIDTSERTGMQFHEMAGSAFGQPYREMRRIVASGKIGTVVQVLVQKSYPYHDGRPQDEDVDGGLLLQVGIHAARFIEHVSGVRIKDASAVQTGLGNPRDGGLKMAVSLMMRLENGGVASMISNYLNPAKFPSWGNETLRIFGTRGFVETVDGGSRTRLVLNSKDCGPLKIRQGSLEYLDLFLDSLTSKAKMPLALEEELHPLRILIRARDRIK